MARLRDPAGSRLYGRAADLKRVEEALEQARVVTLTGTAGVGKTRLAREIARRRVEPSVFVDTTEARGVEGLCGAFARALGFGSRGAAGAEVRALGEALAARGKTLVILDNFEHLVALSPETVAPWIDAAPDASFLVTSRERLHIEGELACDLPPLPPPSPAAPPDEIARCEAVQLFVARARAARGGADPAAEDHEAIAAIVRRLDGVPLAIELAAARADVLGPAQILARLSRPLDLLSAPSRGAPARGTTLRAAIACSWELLTDEERRALVECSVFRGGFTLEAAEEVLGRGGSPVVDLVQTLARKSLLHAAAAREPARYVRLAMFESVRAFVAEVAAAPADAERRHMEHYLRVGEAAGRELRAAQSPAPLATLMAEHENLVAVLLRAERDADDAGSALAAARALAALGPAAWLGASPDAWMPHVDATLAALDRHALAGPPRARVLLLRARAAKQAGRPAEAGADVDAALAIARGEPDPVLEAEALLESALVAELQGEAAERALDRALALAQAHGEHALAAAVAGHAAWARFTSRPLAAQDAFEGIGVGLRSAQAIGDRASEARHRAWLGALHGCLGRSGAARSELESAAQLARELGDRSLQVECLLQQSLLLLDNGDAAGAGAARDEAAAVLGSRAAPRERGPLLLQDGRIATAAGELDAAEAALRAATGGLHGTTDGAVARCLLAVVLSTAGRLDDAEAELALVAGGELVSESLALASAAVGLARARAAEARGELREAEALRRSLEPSLRAAGRLSAPPSPPSLRFAARLVHRAVESTPAVRTALLLGPEAAWFRVPGGEPVGLERRRPLRFLLAFLAAERLARPGAAAPLASLLEAGWPGERVSLESARNRVHVAISALRKLGLRQMLISRDDGWLLEPSVAIVQRSDRRAPRIEPEAPRREAARASPPRAPRQRA